MDSKRWRIAIMGAGAVGGYFGARLAAAGQEVAFVARGTHLEAMQRGGLAVKSIHGNLHVDSLFTSDPAEVGRADLILLAVKSYDTAEAARELAPMMGGKTVVLSLQNGVDNPEKIRAVWEKNPILSGVVFIGARVLAPGVIHHSAGGRIIFGGWDGNGGEETNAVHALLSSAGISCEIGVEMRKVMWGKLVWNAPFCAISSLTRSTVKEILESESLRKLAEGCMEEVMTAARCQGVDLQPSIVADSLSLARSLGDFKPSMLQDLESGKPLEYEAFNGVVFNLLRNAGKPAPINQIFYTTLKFLDRRIRENQLR